MNSEYAAQTILIIIGFVVYMVIALWTMYKFWKDTPTIMQNDTLDGLALSMIGVFWFISWPLKWWLEE